MLEVERIMDTVETPVSPKSRKSKKAITKKSSARAVPNDNKDSKKKKKKNRTKSTNKKQQQQQSNHHDYITTLLPFSNPWIDYMFEGASTTGDDEHQASTPSSDALQASYQRLLASQARRRSFLAKTEPRNYAKKKRSLLTHHLQLMRHIHSIVKTLDRQQLSVQEQWIRFKWQIYNHPSSSWKRDEWGLLTAEGEFVVDHIACCAANGTPLEWSLLRTLTFSTRENTTHASLSTDDDYTLEFIEDDDGDVWEEEEEEESLVYEEEAKSRDGEDWVDSVDGSTNYEPCDLTFDENASFYSLTGVSLDCQSQLTDDNWGERQRSASESSFPSLPDEDNSAILLFAGMEQYQNVRRIPVERTASGSSSSSALLSKSYRGTLYNDQKLQIRRSRSAPKALEILVESLRKRKE